MRLALHHGLLGVPEHGDVREHYQRKWLRAELLHAIAYGRREAQLSWSELRSEVQVAMVQVEGMDLGLASGQQDTGREG